jgi:hypothetical protein
VVVVRTVVVDMGQSVVVDNTVGDMGVLLLSLSLINHRGRAHIIMVV